MKVPKASDAPMKKLDGSSFVQNVVSVQNREGTMLEQPHEDGVSKDARQRTIALYKTSAGRSEKFIADPQGRRSVRPKIARPLGDEVNFLKCGRQIFLNVTARKTLTLPKERVDG